MIYYTEYPTGQFECESDEKARENKAKVIYRESDTRDGRPFVMVKESN